MDKERDILKSIVEPRLNRYLESYAASLEFVDLRHSVKSEHISEEDREKHICSVCLDEIDRCQPFFLGLIGHRYGWIPPENVISEKEENLRQMPISNESLSVTAYELIHGLIGMKNVKGLILMRDYSSYETLPESELSDFVDTGETRKLVETIRNYISCNDRIVRKNYILDPVAPDIHAVNEWAQLVYSSVLDMLSDYLERPSSEAELDDFLIVQEAFVQSKIRKFRGRSVELDELTIKLENRRLCFVCEEEYGRGAVSLLCKEYDNVRRNPDNVCLFFHKIYSYTSLAQIIPLWVKWLNHEYFHDGFVLENEMMEKDGVGRTLTAMIVELTNRGKDVWIFSTENTSDIYSFIGKEASFIACIFSIYTPDMESLRPLCYLVGEYNADNVAKIVEPLRSSVRARLLHDRRSRNPQWLSMAMLQLNNLNKLDFIKIRNQEAENQELSISRYQLEMIDSFPDEQSDMRIYWIDRLSRLSEGISFNEIIYAIGFSKCGLYMGECCSILGISSMVFSFVCDILGPHIVYDNGKGRWKLRDQDVWHYAQDNLDYIFKKKFISNISEYISNNPRSQLAEDMSLCIIMLSRDVARFVRIIEVSGKPSENNILSLKDDFRHICVNYQNEYLNFLNLLTDSDTAFSYKFIRNLIDIIKSLLSAGEMNLYEISIRRLYDWLRRLYINCQIDDTIYSLNGDIMACIADLKYEQGKYVQFITELGNGINYSREMMQKSSMWTKTYLYFIIRKLHSIHPDERKDFIYSAFVRKDQQGRIVFPKGDDTTVYAILLFEASLYLAAENDARTEEFISKGTDVFINLYEGMESGIIDTVIHPIDNMRNMLNSMLKAVYVCENGNDIVDSEFVCEVGRRILDVCAVVKEKFQDDVAYDLYYRLAGYIVMYSDKTRSDKVTDLYNLIFEITGAGGYLTFRIMEKTSSLVSNKFSAFLFLRACILTELSLMDGHEYRLSESMSINLWGRFSEMMIKKQNIEFEDEIRDLLPLCGAKIAEGEHLVPLKMKESILLIYESLLNVELEKPDPDAELIMRVYNSLSAEIGALHGEKPLRYQLHIDNPELLCRIYDEYGDIADYFEDFRDCFGMDGNAYTVKGDMWKYGDPELKSRYCIYDDPNEHTLTIDELEAKIEEEDYAGIIGILENNNELSKDEAYYLALSYLRSDSFESAFKLLDAVLFDIMPEDRLSEGEQFSVITNYLIASLLSGHFEEYLRLYSYLGDDFTEDEDIMDIHRAYLNAMENGTDQVLISRPYGFTL